MPMADPPDRVELGVGEQITLQLPGLGTAGYVWDDELAGDDGVVSVSWTRGLPDGTPRTPPGVSAPELLTIVGEKPGSAVVRLFQHRPWEPPDRVQGERSVTVVVIPAASRG